MSNDKLNIKLNIAGKVYPLTIDRAIEERYRRAEADINKAVTGFKGRFRAEREDYLALAALQIALANVEMEMSRSLGDEVDALKEIEKQLDKHFSDITPA